MAGRDGRLGWVVRSFVLVAAACVASGSALATCTNTSGTVPCYIKVQPIDVCPGGVGPSCAPFNSVSSTGFPNGASPAQVPPAGLPQAGNPSETLTKGNAPSSLVGTQVPNNTTSTNPIGFVVNPSTGLFPGEAGYLGPGVDVTRKLLNNMGVELVWIYPMTVSTTGPSTLNVMLADTMNTVANCSGFISASTLTVTSCTNVGSAPSILATYDFLVSTSKGTIPSNTIITGLVTGSGGTGTYTVNTASTFTYGSSKSPLSFAAHSFTLDSSDFRPLSDQVPTTSTAIPPNPPCAISQMTIPLTSPCTVPPPSPLSSDPGTINLFFVNQLSPPLLMPGTLYGFSWIGNNGVAIGGDAFFAPTPLDARPDTIAHELGHNLGLDHGTYGAGPWTPPNNTGTMPPSYTAPAGIVASQVLTSTPFNGECDLGYPACAANLMTAGSLRTTTTLPCILDPTTPACQPTSFAQGTVDQVTKKSQETTTSPITLPTSQQTKTLGSGLLFDNVSSPLNFAGLLNPIPLETTAAQLGTEDGSTDRVVFELSSPIDGKPGETLVAWILTLPEERTLTRDGGFHIISQSRHDLVQDVDYYPNPANHQLMRNIAYQPGDDNNADNPSIGAASSSPCASATAQCLVIKFQAPGLGEQDSVSFSHRILSGDAPISSDDLCKAKITYVFSDGFVTTSDFARCPQASLPLIASSWHPDSYVAPYLVKSDLLLAGKPAPTLPCSKDPITGKCPPLNAADIDATTEGGQCLATDPATGNCTKAQSCDGGVTFGSEVIGTPSARAILNGPVVNVNANQNCTYKYVEFLGALQIDAGHAYVENSQVDGNVSMTSGTLTLTGSTLVKGNVNISALSTFSNGADIVNHLTIAPSVVIDGNLMLQNLPPNEGGVVCGSALSGGLTLNNNQSSIQIGQDPPPAKQNCPGNTIVGGLICTGNTNLTGGANNLVNGQVSPSCSFLVGP
jgi:hypothetical protein